MKDSDRLNLLRDISNTSFYEKQREDSIQMLEETNQKSQTVSESIDFKNNRLEQLFEEKNQYELYEFIEKQSKAI
jgi:chromosome segregation ATPase